MSTLIHPGFDFFSLQQDEWDLEELEKAKAQNGKE